MVKATPGPRPAVWTIRAAERSDAANWERMRQELWPSPQGEHAGEIRRFFDGRNNHLAEVLIAVEQHGRPVGFAELSIRSHADSCESSGVGYLEGWFVESSYRRRGAGAALVRAAEQWAREQGCTEFASDTEIDNDASAAAHKALGFEEVSRLICFRKQL
ncbi:MAG TPA: aminoglycoside 6'-N-acetyltransferase [Dehalococcoidia bacterium]|nr:aminoglycoside 6'-N-acetyltransferase [Dehalococcoidia bacterium]